AFGPSGCCYPVRRHSTAKTATSPRPGTTESRTAGNGSSAKSLFPLASAVIRPPAPPPSANTAALPPTTAHWPAAATGQAWEAGVLLFAQATKYRGTPTGKTVRRPRTMALPEKHAAQPTKSRGSPAETNGSSNRRQCRNCSLLAEADTRSLRPPTKYHAGQGPGVHAPSSLAPPDRIFLSTSYC